MDGKVLVGVSGGEYGIRGHVTAYDAATWQPKQLPPLPPGMTLDMIRLGCSVFHYAGACVSCHGPNAMGLPDKGSAVSLGSISFRSSGARSTRW